MISTSLFFQCYVTDVCAFIKQECNIWVGHSWKMTNKANDKVTDDRTEALGPVELQLVIIVDEVMVQDEVTPVFGDGRFQFVSVDGFCSYSDGVVVQDGGKDDGPGGCGVAECDQIWRIWCFVCRLIYCVLKCRC